uniref:SFRICE_006231 n=1 Tax=Spodoptera frugiperda TaxID=7108 RepID=A0A2H1W5E6_SPOFR
MIFPVQAGRIVVVIKYVFSQLACCVLHALQRAIRPPQMGPSRADAWSGAADYLADFLLCHGCVNKDTSSHTHDTQTRKNDLWINHTNSCSVQESNPLLVKRQLITYPPHPPCSPSIANLIIGIETYLTIL